MAARQVRSIGRLFGILAAAAASFAAPAAAGMIEGYPDIVICRAGEMRTIGYLHRVMDDGSAVYMALGGEFATVTPDRVLHREGASDCNRKTLEQLERDGQTRDAFRDED